LDIIDIKMWNSVERKEKLPLIVDNTFATPYLQNPLSLGADIVIHSATKYLSGHSDALGGIIIGSENMINRIREEYIFHYGPVISPFNAWLILRGIKTLALRVKRQSDNAMSIAKWLQKHPAVINVYYPGIESGPGHRLAKKQMRGFGGMLSFEVKGGVEAGRKIMGRVKLARLAVSLGSCETLIQHPASMTHSTYTKQERAKAGITDGLIRLSIGIEAAADIISDLENAMQV
jgi:methionine-gamma-lyase